MIVICADFIGFRCSCSTQCAISGKPSIPLSQASDGNHGCRLDAPRTFLTRLRGIVALALRPTERLAGAGCAMAGDNEIE
jgi:hypothetical protein